MEYLKTHKMKILIGLILGISGVGISFFAWGISIWTNNPPFPYYFLLAAFAFLFALLAYVCGDAIYLRYKRSTGELNPVLPEEINNKIYGVRWTFAIALLVNLLVLAILFIIYLISKRWPLL